MRKLAAYVHVISPEGRPMAFGPEDSVPQWAANLITNPDAWEPNASERPEVPAPAKAPVVDEVKDQPVSDTAPPFGGPGSGRAAWAEFATTHQVSVSAGMPKAEIIAACESAGLISKEG